MTWKGERKRHSDVQLKSDLKNILRQPIQKINDGMDIDSFVNGKTTEFVQNGKPIAIRTKDFIFITRDLSPNQIPDLYKKLNTTYSGGSVSLGLKAGHVIVKNIDAEIKKHEKAAGMAGNDISKRMHVQILTALKQIRGSDKTNEFKTALRKELTRLKKNNEFDTTIKEFRRWLKEELMPFDKKSAFEQVTEKIDYEIELGTDSPVFKDIEAFVDIWLGENEDAPDDYIWYHGTTEEKYEKIKEAGEIKISTKETFQHSGFERDIGTISLAKIHGMAHFFSGLSGKGNRTQIILHIDARQLDPAAMTTRKLINTPDGEMLYRKNIPVSAIVKAETVYQSKSL